MAPNVPNRRGNLVLVFFSSLLTDLARYLFHLHMRVFCGFSKPKKNGFSVFFKWTPTEILYNYIPLLRWSAWCLASFFYCKYFQAKKNHSVMMEKKTPNSFSSHGVCMLCCKFQEDTGLIFRVSFCH